MKRRTFFAAAAGIAAVSCAREEKRGARYDEHECPFCTTGKGCCTYCKGTKKCTFCKGTGKRGAAGKAQESCPFCGGKGVCRYCGGKGTCWACDGKGKVDNWDFYKNTQSPGPVAAPAQDVEKTAAPVAAKTGKPKK